MQDSYAVGTAPFCRAWNGKTQKIESVHFENAHSILRLQVIDSHPSLWYSTDAAIKKQVKMTALQGFCTSA
jgi:hypothetical protein